MPGLVAPKACDSRLDLRGFPSRPGRLRDRRLDHPHLCVGSGAADPVLGRRIGDLDQPLHIGVGDSPAWTRNITGIDGGLAATQDDAGNVTPQLANLHGDIVATAAGATSPSSYADNTEFGLPYFSSSVYPTYGWLGTKQRSRNTASGLTLMGVRLYDPNLARFLQTDPVPGGPANPYDYTNQDPVNSFDLDGRWCMFGKNKNGSCRLSRQVKYPYKHIDWA